MRRVARATGSLAALLTVGAALGGCGTKIADAGTPACPRVALLADAAHMTVFRDGPGRDLTDIVYDADLGRISGQCVYTHDKSKVTVEMRLAITAKRGPADRSRSAALPYFVAVVDNQSHVLARQEFDTTIAFQPDQTQAGTLEELEQIIKLNKDQPGSDFQVMVGFRLTPEQLKRNRASEE
jgi:hypothetical protein